MLFCLFFKAAALGQNPAVSYLGIEQGLPNNTVRCILQDKKGFIWFGTDDGLTRYDGYVFKTFRNSYENERTLTNNIISALFEDRKGQMWVGTRQGCSVYNARSGRFTTVGYRTPSGVNKKLVSVIKSVSYDARNRILIGSQTNGLLICTNPTGMATQVPLMENGNPTYAYGVQTIITDRQGLTWVFLQGKGLYRFDAAGNRLQPINTVVKRAYAIVATTNKIWISGGNAIYTVDKLQHTLSVFLNTDHIGFPSITLHALNFDRSGKLWFGSSTAGLFTCDTLTKSVKNIPAGDATGTISGHTVYAIMEDREQRQWIGTGKGGINIIDQQKQKFVSLVHDPANSQSLSGNSVATIYEADRHTLWIGTEGNRINIWNRNTGQISPLKDSRGRYFLGTEFATCMAKDQNGVLWIGSYINGVYAFNSSTGSIAHFTLLNHFSGENNKVVQSMLVDRENNVWAATLRQGDLKGALYRYNRNAKAFEVFDQLSDLFVLYETKNGDMLGGDLQGRLLVIDRANKHHNFIETGNAVRCILQDKKGTIWVGTEGGGLLSFDGKNKKITGRYTTRQGLCNNTVVGIAESHGNIWLSTYNGISCFTPETKKFINYYRSDGLQSNQFNFNAYLKLSSGEIAFGGIHGLNLFNPDVVKQLRPLPPLYFTDIKAGGQWLNEEDAMVKSVDKKGISALEIPYNKSVVRIGFSALEYSTPEKIRYAYIMDGWDKNWNYTGADERSTIYTNMLEGRYTFKVKCTDGSGRWSGVMALQIRILPPWYRSWWAYLLYLLALASVVYTYFNYKARQTRLAYEVALAKMTAEKEKAEHERERIEHEKERIITENELAMQEKSISFFTHVSHEFRTPLSLIINPMKDMMGRADTGEEKELNIMYRNAKRLLSLVDQLLLFRKADSGLFTLNAGLLNFNLVCREVFLCFVQQARSTGLKYELTESCENVMLYADREKLEIILFNLLSNAIKFTPPGGSVNMLIRETDKGAEVLVDDTGGGISPAAGEKLFDKFYQVKNARLSAGFGIGLYLAKQFTTEHKGELNYVSTPGKGTVFTLALLKGKAHFPPDMLFTEQDSGPVFLEELTESIDKHEADHIEDVSVFKATDIFTDKKTILVIDDDREIRHYVTTFLKPAYIVIEAADGETGMLMVKEKLPDLVICDVMMPGINGIEWCTWLKNDNAYSYIPVILLTASATSENKLKGLDGGADDYISKPFDKDLLIARVANLLAIRNNLRSYFYNAVTLKNNPVKISNEYRTFLDKCIQITEQHLTNDHFNIKILASEVGMSHSNLYRKVKSMSGHTINSFIRFIRLRKAAELLIHSSLNVNEVAVEAGFNNIKYFRSQFFKLFGMNPSEFLRRNRKVFAQGASVKN